MSPSLAIMNERFPTSREYQAIPDVHDIAGIFDTNAAHVEAVGAMMAKHSVLDKFNLFAFHKHFDVPEHHVLLQERVVIYGPDIGEVVYPVPAVDLQVADEAVHPVAFFVDGGQLQPYKFARGEGPDLTPHADFLREFVSFVNEHDLSRIFSLKLPNVSPEKSMGEIEVPEFAATALVPGEYIYSNEVLPGSQAAAAFKKRNQCNNERESHATDKDTKKHKVVKSSQKSSSKVAAAVFAFLEKQSANTTFAAIGDYNRDANVIDDITEVYALPPADLVAVA